MKASKAHRLAAEKHVEADRAQREALRLSDLADDLQTKSDELWKQAADQEAKSRDFRARAITLSDKASSQGAKP